MMAPLLFPHGYSLTFFIAIVLILISKRIVAEDAAFNSCSMLAKGGTCNFTINAHSVSSVTGYKINFGDGSAEATFNLITTVTPHVYTTVGVYNAMLTFVRSAGGDITVTKKVTVREPIVNATIKMNSFLCIVGTSINFMTLVTPNIVTDAYYKLGNSSWLAGKSMQCNTTGYHSLYIFIENGISAILFKCRINVTAIEASVKWVPLYGTVNKTMTFTPTVSPFFTDFSVVYVFPTNVVVNCSNPSISYVFSSSNSLQGHPVEVIFSDANENSAKLDLKVMVLDPLVEPLEITCPDFAGVSLPANFSVNLQGHNISYIYDFGDNTPLVNITQNTTTHSFAIKGKPTVTITAKGLVNQISSTCVIAIMESIQGLSCALDLIGTELGKPTALGWVVENGTDFNIKFQISAGLPTYVVSNLTAEDLLVIYKQHNYTKVGEYSVTLHAWNKVNNASTDCFVKVQEPITFINVMFVPKGDCLEMNEDVKVILIVNGTDPLLELDFGLGNGTAYNTSNTEVTHKWTMYGNFTVYVTARNNVSSKVFNTTIFISKPVVEMKTMKIDAKFSNLTDKTKLVMRIDQGSDFKCNISWGYESNSSLYCYNHTYFADKKSLNITPFQNLVLTESFVYPKVGWFVVNVFCFNRKNNVSATTITHVLRPISNFVINAVPPQIFGTSFNISFLMSGGTNVSIRTNFNYKWTTDIVTVNDENGSVVVNYQVHYKSIGQYRVLLNGKNLVSEINTTYVIVVVQDAITSLQCNITSHNPFSDAGLPTRCTNKTDTFAAEFAITFPAVPDKGTNLSCYYVLDDGITVRNTSNLTIEHKYDPVHKHYKPTVTCFNLVSSVSCCFPITMEKTVKTLTATNNGPKKFKHDITFTINVGDFGTGTCFTLDYADGTAVDVYGPEHCKVLTFKQGFTYFYLAETSSFTTSHAYEEVNEYYVKINATNNVSCIATEIQAVSVLKECFYPNVTMRDVSTNITQVPYYYRSETKQFTLNVGVYCEVSNETSYRWKIERVRTFDNITLDKPEETIVPDTDMNIAWLTIQPKTLDYGVYKLTINVSMSKTLGVRTNEEGFIGISCTPYIRAKIIGGNKVRRTVGDVIVFDASSSFDPDHEKGDHRNMTFNWFCRKKNDRAINVNNPETEEIITLPDKNVDKNTLTKGGCFGTGIGRLPFNTTKISVDTSLPGIETGVNKSMVITLVVVKNDTCGVRVSDFEQYVEYTVDVIPLVETSCHQNCLPRINVNEKVSYKTSCTRCQADTKFKWKGAKLKSCDLDPTDPANMIEKSNDALDSMMNGATTSIHMVLKEGVLEGGCCYTFTVRATNPGGQYGENSFSFETNSAPENGSFLLEPASGYTMNTSFKASFLDFVDQDMPMVFSVAVLDIRNNIHVIDSSSEEELEFLLPEGNAANGFNITVRGMVTDRQGAAVHYDWVVTVLPLNATYEYLKQQVLSEGGLFNQAVQQGDLPGVIQQTSILSAMVDKLNQENEAQLKNNLTEEEIEIVNGRTKEIQQMQTSVLQALTKTRVVTMNDAKFMSVGCNGITSSYTTLNDESLELSSVLVQEVASKVLTASPAEQRFSDTFDVATLAFSSMGQISAASANKAKFNSTEHFFNISGTSKENLTGMVSDTERAKARVQQMTNTLKNMQKKMLDWVLPGEKPIVTTSTTLNTSSAQIFLADLQNTVNGFGKTSLQFPAAADMGLVSDDDTKATIGSLVSTSSIPWITWTNSSDQMKSMQVNVDLTGKDGDYLSLSRFSKDAEIAIPRDASNVPKIEQQFLRTYKETDHMVQSVQFQILNVTSVDMASHLQVIPLNETLELDLYVQYGERAIFEEGKFLYHWKFPDFSSCKLESINKTTIIGDQKVVFMDDPDKYCEVDPYTALLSFDMFNKTGLVYITIVHTLNKTKDPAPTEATRNRRAIPGVPCGESHGGRMKRSCVFIPPPPPTPPTEPPWGTYVEVGTKSPFLDFMGRMMDMNTTIKYGVRIYQTNCIFFNETTQAFANNGCKVSNRTRKDKVVCLCDHFTSFGSDFFVAPNPIDFDKVFSADLSKNPVVLSVVCGLFGLYLILVVFARRADKRDEKKIGVTPLPANAAPGSRSYLISIHTGVRMNAGTTANVYVVLSGEEGEAPPVLLKDPERPLFTRGADNALVMTIPRSVGKITHVRVWHDNTGLSPSWYLSRIVLEDLHDHNKVYFVCERWLAVEEDDGRVDRIIPVASDKELTKFNHLFVSKTVQELGDGHLWFSIIARPPQSVFTRVQRLSVALSLLYCTMITSCMFYNTGGKKEDPTYILYLGSLKIDLKQMIIGLQSSLIVFPVNLAFMQIFRKIRPDDPNANTEKAEDITEGFDDVWEDEEMKEGRMEKEKKKKKEKKGLHPRWRYVAWIICALSTTSSATFTVFYSLDWGPDVANKWLIAFVLSFFQSVLLIQPVKVVFAAIVFALIIKKPIENEQESNKDEAMESCTNNIHEKPMMSDDYLFSDGTRVGPPDELMLMAARQKRLKEIRMQIILREISAFFIFMGVLLLVAYGNRDPNAYLFRKSLYDSFVQPSVGDKVPFSEVGDIDSFWHWTRESLLPTLYPGPWYNGKKDKYTGFLDDRHNYLVGISRLRQERVKPNTCTVVPIFRHVFPTCYSSFSLSNEENRDFDVSWKYLNNSAVKRKRRSIQEQLWFVKESDQLVEYNPSRKILKRERRAIDPVYRSDSGRQARKRDRGSSKTYTIHESAILDDGSIMSCPSRWQYHSLFELRGFPYWGMLNFYTGGGYPADLGYDFSTAMTVIADTNSHNWLDEQSRAIFNEFTIYNANTNLFAAAFLFMEFLPNGGALSSANFVVSRLYSYVGPFSKLILAMEIFMLLFMLYFMYREFKLMYKQGKAYFRGFWNLIEVTLIVLEFVMTILFFVRMWETDKNFIKLHHNPKDFVSFQYATAADLTLTYVVGFLVFLVTLRFLKLLRFNKKMAFIGTTISVIAKPIGLFMISFSVVFASYNCFGVLIFGAASEYYKDNLTAAITQMRILLGDFDYFELSDIEPILGPIYFFTYMYLIVFFLMNMFLAIINDSFSEVKELEDKLSNEYEMMEFIMDKLKSQMAFMKKENPSQIKTPYGPGSAVPFWEYKHRRSSISSDSEFSCTTNMTAVKAKRDLKLMEDDLEDLIKRLCEMEVEDVEYDEAFVQVAQIYQPKQEFDSDSDSDSESYAETQLSQATKSIEDDALSRSTAELITD